MARTRTETMGFAQNIRGTIRDLRGELEGKGLDPDRMFEIIDALIQRTADLEATQEKLKRDLVSTTAALEASDLDLDRLASGYLDVLMAGSLVRLLLEARRHEPGPVGAAAFRLVEVRAGGLMAGVGKGTDAAKNLQHLRSRIRMPENSHRDDELTPKSKD